MAIPSIFYGAVQDSYYQKRSHDRRHPAVLSERGRERDLET
jgi:hypothetical protein